MLDEKSVDGGRSRLKIGRGVEIWAEENEASVKLMIKGFKTRLRRCFRVGPVTSERTSYVAQHALFTT